MKLLVISINDEKILYSKIFFTIFSKMTLIEAIVIKVSKFNFLSHRRLKILKKL